MTRSAQICSTAHRRRPRPAADPLERRTLLSGVSFGAPAAYGSGSSLGVIAVDLNRDGLVDVLSPNSTGSADGINVALNAGNGTLDAPVFYPAAGGGVDVSQPYALATADFNGDGYPDVASANFGGSLSILLNDRSGGLGAATNLTAGSEPDGIAVGDLTGGGLDDVVVANRGSNNVSVFSNNDGVFSAAVNYPVGSGPGNVAVADLNGDGKPDIVTANADDTLSVLINNGDGTFAPAVSVADPNGAVDVKVADVNRDGLPDLVVSDGNALVSVYPGNGTGTTFGARIDSTAGSANEDLVVADFNGDGIPDVAIGEFSTRTLDVLIGNGDGAFQAPVAIPSGLNAWSIAAGDLNGDGQTDLVVGSYDPGGSDPAFTTLFNTTTPTSTVVKTIGGLDPTFGTNGLASHDVGFSSTAGVATDGAQSVLIGPAGAAPSESFGVARYNGDGTLDTAFGTGGLTTTPFAGLDAVPSAVAALSSGNILVAGTATTYGSDGSVAGSEFAVAEYTSTGALDGSFGTGGTVTIEFGASLTNDVLHALAVGPGGAVYLGGSSDVAGKGNTDLAVARLTAAGALDPGFAKTGATAVDVAGADDMVNAIAVQTNGDLVAAGSATVGGTAEVALARFLANGTLDKHFGTKGITTDKVGGVYDSAQSVVLQPKGQIVVGGLAANGAAASLSSDFLVQRYTSAGRLDRSFGAGGTTVTTFGQPSAVTQLVLQSDGSIVASGRTSATLGGTLDVAVARYTTRGVLDKTFAGTGKVVIDLSSGIVPSPAILRAAIASALGAAFDAFTSSAQGVVTVTAGGEILSAGNSGADTVEAELVAVGVDLVAKILSALPASVLAGVKAKVTVNVSESGSTQATGTVTIQLQFATNAQGAGAVSLKPVAERVNLRAGQAKSYVVPYSYPTGLASGGYFLLATVATGTGLPAELDAGDNTAAKGSVTIAPPFTALGGSALAVASPFVIGKSATVALEVANGGNVPATGHTTVELFLSTDGTVAGGTQVADLPLPLGLAAGKSKPARLHFKLPTTVVAGTYELLAVLDPTDGQGNDTTAGRVVAAAGTVSVS